MSSLLPAVLALSLLTPAVALADCLCRMPGGEVPVGTLACLKPGGVQALYRCAMNQNVTAWQRVGPDCPLAALPIPSVEAAALAAAGHGGAPRLLR